MRGSPTDTFETIAAVAEARRGRRIVGRIGTRIDVRPQIVTGYAGRLLDSDDVLGWKGFFILEPSENYGLALTQKAAES